MWGLGQMARRFHTTGWWPALAGDQGWASVWWRTALPLVPISHLCCLSLAALGPNPPPQEPPSLSPPATGGLAHRPRNEFHLSHPISGWQSLLLFSEWQRLQFSPLTVLGSSTRVALSGWHPPGLRNLTNIAPWWTKLMMNFLSAIFT